jgi:hypothetical protein
MHIRCTVVILTSSGAVCMQIAAIAAVSNAHPQVNGPLGCHAVQSSPIRDVISDRHFFRTHCIAAAVAPSGICAV